MSPSVREPVVHSGVKLDEKDRIHDSKPAGFTPVNGRQSPPQPVKSAERSPDADRPPAREWHPRSVEQSERTATPAFARDVRPASPAKRKRAPSDDDDEAEAYSRHPAALLRRITVTPDDSSAESDESLPHENGDPSIQSRGFGSGRGPHQQHHLRSEADGKERTWYERPRLNVLKPVSQYADTLQREPQSLETQTGNGHHVEAGALAHEPHEYGSTTELTRAGVQVDPKKRKRMFSNRTKTGCQTCRRRKKKCDEAKPECQNCIRGGFVCEGYLTKSPWTKPGMAKSHIPLQSKHGYPENSGIYPRHPPTETYPDTRAPPSMEDGRARPVAADEEQNRATARNAWGPVAWQEPPRTYPQERPVNSEYSRTAPPPSDHIRRHPTEYEQVAYGHSAPPRPVPTSAHQPQHPSNSQSAMTARLALQHQSSTLQRAPQPQPPLTEKEKMLSGDSYLPFSEQLVDEREQCKAALWRFNNATNPSVGVSREERARLFRAILEPQHLLQRIQAGQVNPIGSLGKDVCVEAPFTCDYGYNIIIGDDVVIGHNCTILDANRVVIGPKCILGPNVSIYTNTVSTSPTDRNGSKGPARARSVTIEQNVYIGGNVTILPGAHISKDSTVEAGSVVSGKFGPLSLIAGNPASFKGGVWLEASYAQR